jgi:hypothetical protein
MGPLPLSAVNDAWHDVYDTDEAAVQAKLDTFAREQPVLLQYVLTCEEDIEKLDDRGFLTLYALWIWLAFKKNGRDASPVSESTINGAFETNMSIKEVLDHDTSGSVMDAADGFALHYKHQAMLGAIAHDVHAGELESGRTTDDITGMILLTARTIIDALDR